MILELLRERDYGAMPWQGHGKIYLTVTGNVPQLFFRVGWFARLTRSCEPIFAGAKDSTHQLHDMTVPQWS